ncbi:MAG: E3 ubiquitin ligase family protein [Bacteroidales bacterium]|nr:E3 ubiquitin ligase family protein [Bacteroidales bacterium]
MGEVFCAACIADMASLQFYMMLAFAAVLALVGLHSALRALQRARLIEDIPTSRIRSASQGFVELAGIASGRGEVLASPLSATPCLWWRYSIERLEQSGKSRRWRVLERGLSDTPFYLDDGTGLCRIKPAGAEVSCLHRRRWQGRERRPGAATPAAGGLVSTLGRLAALGGRYRYTEYLIRDGDPLYALGHFETDATGARLLTVDQAAGQLIRHWKQDFDQLLVRFDRDGNGILDNEEWLVVTEAARREALREQIERAGDDPGHRLRAPQERGLPYLLGSRGQELVSRQLRRRAAGMALLFLAAGAMATWLLTSRLGA